MHVTSLIANKTDRSMQQTEKQNNNN